MAKYFSYPQGLYAAQPGSGIMEFDWKYYDTHNGGTDQQAYLYFYAENQSFYCVVSVYLGRDLNINLQTNDTYDIYVNATGFGHRGSWQHEVLDLGSLLQQVNIRNVDIDQITFWVNVGNQANSSVTLLVDNFQYRTYPTIDPGFEQDWYWSGTNPVTGWVTEGAAYPYVNRTHSAHSGNWAANITVHDTTGAGLYRDPFVKVDESLFTDFWFKVNGITSVGTNYAYVTLWFDGGFSLTYVVAASSAYSPINSSTDVCYFVNGFNQTGTWRNIVRNVQADLEALFSHQVWNLTDVEVYSYAGIGGRYLSSTMT